MKKTWICVIALLAVCALAVTGCGKKDSEDTEAPGTVTINSVESGELTEFDYMENDLTPYVTLGNYEGLLPEKNGRTYTECDIDTLGAKSRGAKRIVFSNDGLIYYTEDHYESFELLYGEE